ncbi:MAG: hypothetical protein ACN4EF_01530, partial [Wenyingzhuangia sp.]
MKKYILIWILVSMTISTFSQEIEKTTTKTTLRKETRNTPIDSIKNMYGARYVDYKMITYHMDTLQIDTTLTIEKYFRHN